jgi:hypothetical protein
MRTIATIKGNRAIQNPAWCVPLALGTRTVHASAKSKIQDLPPTNWWNKNDFIPIDHNGFRIDEFHIDAKSRYIVPLG